MPTALHPFLVKLHRYLGLTLLGFLLVISLTGFFLAFEREWDAVLNPELYQVSGSATQTLSPSQLVAAVETRLPRAQVTHLPLPGKAERALMLEVEPRIEPSTGRPYQLDFDEVFVDPGNGAINGVRQWGECCSRANLLPLLYKLHNRLLLPSSTGRRILAGIALGWLLLSTVGVYLALFSGRRRASLRSPLFHWRQGLSGRARLRQLHRLAGLWALPLMLVSIVTGVAMALDRELAQPLATALACPAGPDVWEQRADPATEHRERAVSFDTALETARTAARGWPEAGGAVAIDRSPRRGLYRVRFAHPVLPGASPRDVYVDSASGTVVGETGEVGLARTLLANRQTLHGGDLLGPVGRVLVATTGLLLALMALTGLLMTLRRQTRQNTAVTTRSPRADGTQRSR